MKNKILIIFLLGLLILFNIFVHTQDIIRYTTVSDEDVLYYGAKSIISNNTLSYESLQNKKYDTCLITSYVYSMDSNKNLYYSTHPTTLIFYSYFLSLFGESSFFNLTLFFTSLIILFFFLISLRISNSYTASFFSTLAMLLYPVFFKLNIGYYDIIPTVLFLLVSFFYLLRKELSKTDLILSCLFFILAVSIRISELILLPGFLLLIFLRTKKFKVVIAWSVGVILFLATYFLFNYHFFGNLLYVAETQVTFYPCYQIGSLVSSPLIETLRYFYVGDQRFTFLIEHLAFLFTFLIKYYTFSVFSIIGIFYCFSDNKKEHHILFFISVLILTIFLYGHGNAYYGYLENNLQNSFLRYTLFTSLLLLSYSSVFTFKILKSGATKKKIILIFLLVSILLLSIPTTLHFNKNGIIEYNQNRIDTIRARELVKSYQNPNSFFITTAVTDKTVYPDFQNIISIEKYYTNAQVPKTVLHNDLSSLITKLFNERKIVYYISHNSFEITDSEEYLRERYNFKFINSSKIITIYELSQKNETLTSH